MRHFSQNGGRYRKVDKHNRVYDRSRSRSKNYKQDRQEILKTTCETLVKELSKHNNTEYVEEMKYEVHEIKFIHEAYFSDAKENKEFKWDCGAPKTVAGKIWVEDYLGRLGKKIEDFKIEKTRDSFKFGESVYKSLGKILMPVHMKD